MLLMLFSWFIVILQVYRTPHWLYTEKKKRTMDVLPQFNFLHTDNIDLGSSVSIYFVFHF